MAFTNVFEADFRLPGRMCILAPGPAGRAYYRHIPPDFGVIAVSKAVLVEEVHPQVWMMNHVVQDWYAEANRAFEGVRVFSYEAAMQAQPHLQNVPDCYYFTTPEDEFLELEVQLPLEGIIRYGATVSACAVQLAYNLGATELLLCGVDMSGDGYFDGSTNVHLNHGAVWPAVRRLNPLLRYLIAEKGIRITTLSPTQLDLPMYTR